MRLGLIIYGSLDTLSGGYLYDRKLVDFLRAQGDTVEIISLPWRNYAAHLADNLSFRLPPGLDLVIQDELNHPSLTAANRRPHPYPVISLVHHLRCSELRPAWQNALYRQVERRYLASVDGFIFNSKTTRSVVHALAGDARPHVVAYPPTDRFGSPLPSGLVRSRATDSAPLRILFLGNVIPRKGLHTILEAVSSRPSAFRLEVVGSLQADPGYAQKMQAFTTVHGLSSTVHFHGPLDNAPLVELLKSSHVLVVPSSYEGFGIVYLEGMAFGLPAIGTTAGAASEVISENETGYLISPEDAPALAARLSALAADRALLARLSLNALERYRQQPAWEETAGSIRRFLQSSIG
jgi:glycosyltransferase involved in cell wall biosynthesis